MPKAKKEIVYKPFEHNLKGYGLVKFLKVGYKNLTEVVFNTLTDTQKDIVVRDQVVDCEEMDTYFKPTGISIGGIGLTCDCGQTSCVTLYEVVNADETSMVMWLGSTCIERFLWGKKFISKLHKEAKDKIKLKEAKEKEAQIQVEKQMQSVATASTIKFNFGKYTGKLISTIYKNDPNYLEWIINNVKSSRKNTLVLEYVRKFIDKEFEIVINLKN